jgi:uncharacterized secreted protein with C-terminal beta-propeller domain
MQKISKLLALLLVTAACGTETAKKIKDTFTGDDECGNDAKCGRTGSEDAEGKPLTHEEIERSGLFLRQFDTCSDVEQAIEKRVIDYLRQYTEQQIKNYGRAYSAEASSGDTESVASASPGNAAPSEKSSTAPDAYSTTNNQVAGVEESDILKNTGTHIFHASGRYVHIAKSWPANEMKNVHTLKYDGRPSHLLLVDERTLVVLVQSQNVHYYDMSVKTSNTGPHVELYQYDVTDPSAPKLIERYQVNGRFITMRRIDKTIKLIVADNRMFPEKMIWPSAYDYTADGNSYSHHFSSKKAWKQFDDAVKLIEEADLNFWLDSNLIQRGDAQHATSVNDEETCKKVFLPESPANWGRTHIVSINLHNSEVDRSTLIADVQQAYASKKSLYLTTPYYWWFGNSEHDDHTYIHTFDLVDLDTTNYLGSGYVKGQLINQFAMDEYEDSLRVASTVNRWGARGESFSQVSVLQLKDSKLQEVGKVSDLAKGESIQSVRFMGKRGFVVTFERIDPLFTLDLSSAADPKVIGELKIPGFSTYMHPIDENHLLAIGRNGDNWGATRGMKLSIFDVTDLKDPKEAHVMQIDEDFYSEAQNNHLAFNYFAPKKTLALPLSGWKWERNGQYSYDFVSKLQLIRIDVESGFKDLGDVVMVDTTNVTTPNRTAYAYANAVERSVFADNIVYAVSGVGIQAADIDNPSAPISELSFECDGSCFENWYW